MVHGFHCFALFLHVFIRDADHLQGLIPHCDAAHPLEQKTLTLVDGAHDWFEGRLLDGSLLEASDRQSPCLPNVMEEFLGVVDAAVDEASQ